MYAFVDVSNDCNLVDVGFEEVWYTLERGQFVSNNNRECLDRGVMTEGWRQLFPCYRISHLSQTISNHFSLPLETHLGRRFPGLSHCKFEVAWLMETTCEEEVQCLWNVSGGTVLVKVGLLCHGLNRWFSRLKQEKGTHIRTLSEKLEQLSALYPTDFVLEELVDFKLALNLGTDKEEVN